MKHSYGRPPTRRLVFWAGLGFVLAVLLAPLPGYWFQATAVAETSANPPAEFWRQVRQGVSGYSAVTGPEAAVLIQNGGENWRALRNGPVSVYGAWIMAGMLLVIGLYFLVKGRVRIDNGRSGLVVSRWDVFDRVVHWWITVLFLILAVTGLSLLFGRTVLIPLLGKDAFAAYAGFAKDVHNYLGPFFAVGLVLAILKWRRINLFNRADMTWLAQGGGMIGSAHVPAGQLNAGEKVLFWLVTLLGLAVVVSGLVLNFPNFGQTRDTMQLYHLIHVATAIPLIALIFGHIYMATLGTEGALEGMIDGRVDARWAQQHHDLWYRELLAKGVKPEPVEPGVRTAPAQPRLT